MTKQRNDSINEWSPDDFAPVTMTARALTHLQKKIKQQGGGMGLRLGVKPTGCNGYQYVVDYVTEVDTQDRVFATDDPTLAIYVSPQAMPFVAGTVIDYQQQGLNTLFTFDNPQVTSACGCGESFGIDPAADDE